ncbi:MAG: glycosyltransferase, partial [Bacteroidota bacterium]
LLERIKDDRKNISFFLCSAFDWEIRVELLKSIKELEVPTVLICYDNSIIPFYHRETAAHYDVVWLTSPETESLFQSWGANTLFMPYAANPHIFIPSSDILRKCVGFIGTMYGNRPRTVNFLTENKVPCEIYTDLKRSKILNQNPINKSIKRIHHSLRYSYNLMRFSIGWKILFGTIKKSLQKNDYTLKANEFSTIANPVSFEKMIELYSQFALTYTSIDLKDTFSLKNPLQKIHLRVFETAACGGLQITHRTDEIEDYFEEDKEIILFDSQEELLEKVNFYLENASSAKKIKKAARERITKQHTWKHRFDKLLTKILKNE